MSFYQASICRDATGRYFVACVHEVGNPLKIRVDQFTDGTRVLRLPVTRDDWLDNFVPWGYVDPRALSARYNAHCAKERTRIARALAGGKS